MQQLTETLLTQLNTCQQQLQQLGYRRMLILSGDAQWSIAQTKQLQRYFQGDWWWISERAIDTTPVISAKKIRHYLGRECLHGVFDATQGLDVEALAILAGMLAAGSWLVILLADWQTWSQWLDADSIRWSDCQTAIATPHFMQRMQQQLQSDPDILLWQQNRPLMVSPLTNEGNWQPADGSPTTEQATLLQRLLQADKGSNWVLTAARGRGKSALAGMLIERWAGHCWLTAPSQASTQTVQHYSKKNIPFFAPDALLAHCQQSAPQDIDWLIIDEAAAIPTPLLSRLVAFFPRVLLTTTVQGYEGTGRGFILKLCTDLPNSHFLNLSDPVRWAAGDPVERVIDQLLLFQEQEDVIPSEVSWQLQAYSQQQLIADRAVMEQFYLLLTSAHYRTRPLDLRRLMDAPGMRYQLAITPSQQVIGGIWLVEEGGLSAELAQDIWAGRRRPRGNLVAQSLAAHSNQWQAPILRSWRISRIAVLPQCRRLRIGSQMISRVVANAQQQRLDYLSVSFGYTDELWSFWQQNGFHLVRVGEQREARSGCYVAMAIYPLSQAGEEMCIQAEERLADDLYWSPTVRADDHFLSLPTIATDHRAQLNEEDWRELAGFAFAHRPLESSRAALCRLINHSSLPLPALRLALTEKKSVQQIVQHCGLTGQKALLQQWRNESAAALQQQDQHQLLLWRQWVTKEGKV